MQRSRKALLTRRALWKTNRTNFFYKASLPPVVFMWGLLFLLYIRIGHDDGYRDGLIDLPKDSYTYQTETKSGIIQNHAFINKTQQIHFSFSNEELKETKTERFLVQDLDEFKNKAFGGAKMHPSNPNPDNIIHRLEPSGAKYNYASSSKGAKVLAHNKDAKGAPNILNTDQNQYLRNPCSSEDKFVILELSEETLIDTIEIANFEHHSSNLKGFEVFGSSVYPTESWVKLGIYTAVNVKNSQRFVLRDSKWVRYVKLNLQSHYGTGFYCTLSTLRVYGVDAVEMMLEDLVFARNNEVLSNEHESDGKPEAEDELWLEERANVPDPHVGRLPGDSVLREIDAEIGERDVVVEKVRMDLRDFHDSKDVVKEHVDELESWKSLVSIELDIMTMDNAFLRSEVAKLRVNQERMEDTGVVIFLVSLTFGLFAIANLFLNKLLFIYYRDDRTQKSIVEFG
ncbi:unnamed protein product [Lactuca virosa]|uniref:SUN domain-containing protein n=1 Tax=Lactuca virosa TaxID=75947 RepID=A0AAU9MGS6_9ASTR|nr:unnamed protein product [Lactuca virosa]